MKNNTLFPKLPLSCGTATLFVGVGMSALAFYEIVKYWGEPGPLRIPLIGSLIPVRRNMHRFVHWLCDEVTRAKTKYILVRVMWRNCYCLSDPEDVKHVLQDNWKNFTVTGGLRATAGEDFFGRGIFNSDGHQWFVQRKNTSREFSTNRFRTFMANVFQHFSIKLCDVLQTHAESKQPVDISSLFFKLTLDSFGRIAFDVDLGGLAGKPLPFAFAFDRGQERVAQRCLFYYIWLFRLIRWLGVGPEKAMRGWIRTIDDFVYDLIDGQLSQTTVDPSTTNNENLLSRLIATARSESNADELDRALLRDLVVNFIIAGRDTTACALSWMFYELALHPHLEEPLLEEINQKTNGSTPSFDNMGECHYFKAFLTETLRLHPSVPLDPKTCNKRDVLPSGAVVDAGDSVLIDIYAMGRSKAVWGDNALEFDPERFLDLNGTFRRPDPYSFCAFQAGPRVCLGIDMAYLEMKVVAANVLQRYHLELVPGQDISPALSIVNQMKNGLKVIVHERKNVA